MSRRQRRAAEITADLEWLALHGFSIGIRCVGRGWFKVSIARTRNALPIGEQEPVEFDANTDTLDGSVCACVAHAREAFRVEREAAAERLR